MDSTTRRPDESAIEAALAALAGEYDIERELGRGGTAVVFAGRDRALARPVAIKLVVPAGEEDHLEGLAREARTAAQLVHPNIVAVHAVRTLPGGALALVMQYVPGRTLREVLISDGALPINQAAAALADIAHGLHHAHLRGTVHGDVKPENVLLDETTGRALLSDFGAAVGGDPLGDSRAMFAGTPAYMAPEQVEGGVVDIRSDIFSLGVVGWELLTGLSPWGSGSPRQILARRIESLPPPVRDVRPDTPAWLAEAIDRALKAAPEERWQSADSMAEALETQRRGSRFGSWRKGRAAPPPRHQPSTAAAAASSMDTVRFERSVPALPPDEVAAGPIAPPRERGHGKRIAAALAAVLLMGAAGAYVVANQGGISEFLGPSVTSQDVTDTRGVEVPVFTPPAAPDPYDSSAGGMPGGATTDPNRVDAPDERLATVEPDSVEPQPPDSQPRGELPPTLAEVPPRDTAPADTVTSGLRQVVGASSTTNTNPRDSVPPGTGDTVMQPPPQRQVAVAPPPSPPPAPSGVDAAARTVAGGQHSCLLDRSGVAWCWGSNAQGQAGTSGSRIAEPERVGGNLRFTSLAAGRVHSCGVTTAREVWCWGGNDRGQVGDGSRVNRSAPSRIAMRTAGGDAAVGANHACALDSSGTAWCWGANDRGQTGSGSFGSDVLTPRRVAGSHRFRSLTVGWDHSCALDSAGRAWCWGSNENGRLGDGSTSDHAAPVLVSTKERFTQISAGGTHTCAVASSGKALCWGQNSAGQLGDGTIANSRTPVEVAAGTSFASITVGSSHSCALARDGTARCWGRNSYGQLGDGSTTDRVAPVAVAGGVRFIQLNASGAHTCGTAGGGAAYCWGYNVQGQLGDGTRTNRARPVRVGGA